MNNDGNKFYNMTKWLLMAAGIWTLHVEDNLKMPYKTYKFFLRFNYLCCNLAIAANFIVNVGVNNRKAVESLAITISNLCITLKLILCMAKRMTKLLKMAIEDLKNNVYNDNQMQGIVLKYTKRITILNIIIITYTFGLTAHFSIYGGLVEYYKYTYNHPNITEKPTHLLLMWFPFDLQKHFNSAIALQIFILITCSAFNFSTQGLFNTMMVYVVIKLKMLQHFFRNFDKGNGTEMNNLQACIRKHQELIEFAQDLNSSMKYLLLIEYSVSSVMLASVFVQITERNQIEINIPHALILTFQLFLLSWNAHEIKTQKAPTGVWTYGLSLTNRRSKNPFGHDAYLAQETLFTKYKF
ncbi:unnamed protein product [Ceutorhynchus assimilis]|uniref:Odorant receptor n=1 Tax=Ceutorhynchus assimilis TaxID=467358 RepID=A0A9N9MTE0_9CUCU|nr:unnamed protein product [Ceutorhynchus assimilis]